MLVWERDKCCQPRPIELLGCSPRVEVATMRLQPAAQALNPPVLARGRDAGVAITAVASIVSAKEAVCANACA